ncbi:hypothetical protein GN958_ATG23016, partial [Phytophthora infestans]
RYFIQCEDVQATLANFYPSLNDYAREQRRKLIYQCKNDVRVLEERCKTASIADMRIATILPKKDKAVIVQWINLLRKEGVPITRIRVSGAYTSLSM